MLNFELKPGTFRILLVRPPYTRLRGTGQAPYFPLGLGYLAAVLNQNPLNQAVIYNSENPDPDTESFRIDMESVFNARSNAHKRFIKSIAGSEHIVWEEFQRILLFFKPQVIGISVLTPEVASAVKLSEMAKAWSSECVVIWGGVHPTFALENTLRFTSVDYIVTGEGERSFSLLIDALRNQSDIQGISGVFSSKSAGSPSSVSSSDLIENLDSIPFPSRKKIFFPDRVSPLAIGSLMHSRGCPWRCGFCSSRLFWQKAVRFRSPEQVIEEIQQISTDFGIRFFTFWDDAFTIDRSITEELCLGIIRKLPKIAWRTATRVDLLDDSMLKLLKKSGCIQLELGLETGSPRMAEIIHKDIDLDQVPSIIDHVNRSEISCGVFLMAGFPDEKRQDLEQTLKFIHRIHPAEIVLNIWDPMPGSEQFDRARELGMIASDPDYTDYLLWPDKHFVVNMQAQEFNDLVTKISEYVFTYNRSYTARLKKYKPQFFRLLKADPVLLLRKVAGLSGLIRRQ